MTISGSRSQFCGLEPALKKPSRVGYNQTADLAVSEGTAPSKGFSNIRIRAWRSCSMKCVSYWRLLSKRKKPPNRQKLWCGGSEILFREFWLPWEFSPSDQWIPAEIFVPFVVIWGSVGERSHLTIFCIKQLEILVWNSPQDADEWGLLEWLTHSHWRFCLKKHEYLAPGNEDLGAWSRRGRWRGEMWLDREGWREE